METKKMVDWNESYKMYFDKFCGDKVIELGLNNWLELNYGFIDVFEKKARRCADYDYKKDITGSFYKIENEFEVIWSKNESEWTDNDKVIMEEWIELNDMILS